MNLPILQYIAEQGDNKLLNHEITTDEKALFRELDAATAAVDSDQLEAIYEVIVPIGAKYGLSRNETIAFWTRCTFGIFEPCEFAPGEQPDEPPVEFNDLMFLALDHGFASIEDGSDPLIPFAMVHITSGERKMQRFVCEHLEVGVDQAKAFVEQNQAQITMYAIAWDGYITLKCRKWNAVFVEAGMNNRPNGFLLCQRYEAEKSFFRKKNKAVGNPIMVSQPPSRIHKKREPNQ
ncbi:MAG: hypothetical protein JSV49_10055 [Thermoplasmata archaeon]|nr:MAG: hypothetical protein JSV49_10055 [Thermoplasmata archaeon]